jgi:hypothetical protein
MLTQRLYKDSVFSNLPRTVKFARWQDTPTCDCCGWDVEQRKEVVPQGVRQDRESSMKQLLQLTGYSSGSPALGPTLQSVCICVELADVEPRWLALARLQADREDYIASSSRRTSCITLKVFDKCTVMIDSRPRTPKRLLT